MATLLFLFPLVGWTIYTEIWLASVLYHTRDRTNADFNHRSFVLVSSSNLSLPIALGTKILAIVLPLLATANVYYAPILQRMSQERKYTAAIVLAPSTLQIIQGILTVVLATLSFEGVLPGADLNCSLHNVWQQLWRNHDSRAIERIQDAFNCCGLASLRDMSEPHHNTDTSLCSSMYHRASPCAGPWTNAMQRNSGIGFGVAVTVGILQLLHLALFRMRNAYSSSRLGYERLTQSVGSNPHDRLLENGTGNVSAEVEDGARSRPQGYGTTDVDANPSVVPSHLNDDNSPWRE